MHCAGVGTKYTGEKHFVVAYSLEVHRMERLSVDMQFVSVFSGGLDGNVCSAMAQITPGNLAAFDATDDFSCSGP